MNVQIDLKLLGEVLLCDSEQGGIRISYRKAKALLFFLAVERDAPHRRAYLADLLWPETREKYARQSLRQALFALRQAFPLVASHSGTGSTPLVVADDRMLQFNPDAAVEVDALQLDAAIECVKAHSHANLAACRPCFERLEEAVKCYRGDFLDGFYLADSSPFEEWAQTRREYFRRLVLEALEKLASACIQLGELEQAGKYARWQYRINPYSEAAYRQHMEIFALQGRRSEAIGLYRHLEQFLEEEFQTAPALETRTLFESIQEETLVQQTFPVTNNIVRDYELRERLGSGHAGAVFKAYHPKLGRDVAVKIVLPQYTKHLDFQRRLEFEARLSARLEHLHIVPLYDYWCENTGTYLVMRWMKGGSLKSDLERGPWKPQAAMRLAEQISAALSFAHRQGVVHNDVKPANILLDEDRNAYLSDFGISRFYGTLAQVQPNAEWQESGSPSDALEYASPEVVLGETPSPLSDVYSLGILLFEVLAGRQPFPGLWGDSLIRQREETPFPSVRRERPELPDAVDEVIQKAVDITPTRRYQEASSLALDFCRAFAAG